VEELQITVEKKEKYLNPSLLEPTPKPARATHDAKEEYLRVNAINSKKLIECGKAKAQIIHELGLK
jgi:hypothetical protein